MSSARERPSLPGGIGSNLLRLLEQTKDLLFGHPFDVEDRIRDCLERVATAAQATERVDERGDVRCLEDQSGRDVEAEHLT